MTEILFKEESYKIVGLCMKIHKELGAGFFESVYQEALELELKKNNIPFEKEKKLPVYYNGQPLKKYFCADFSSYDSIVMELKQLNIQLKQISNKH